MLIVMARIIFLPGIGGTELAIAKSGLFGPVLLWPSGFNIAHGQLVQLQLDPDGISPGPLTSGDAIIARRPYLPFYGKIIDQLRSLGHTVYPYGYDFRLSVVDSGRRVWQLINADLTDPPYTILAHSLGGIVAKVVYSLFKLAGLPNFIQRIIQFGTPNYGSWSTNDLLWRRGELYDRIIEVQGYGLDRTKGRYPDYLDAVLATWPSVYELMPYKNQGPLLADYPLVAARIYDIASYAGANPYTKATRLAAAPAVQDAYAGNPDSKVTYQFWGNDRRTTVVVDRTQLTNGVPLRITTQQGDGTVTFDQSNIPDTSGMTFDVDHNELVLNQSVLNWMATILHGL